MISSFFSGSICCVEKPLVKNNEKPQRTEQVFQGETQQQQVQNPAGYIKIILLNKHWGKRVELMLPIGVAIQHEDFIFHPRAYRSEIVGQGHKIHQAFLEIWKVHENSENGESTKPELFFSNVLTSEKTALYDEEYEVLLVGGE